MIQHFRKEKVHILQKEKVRKGKVQVRKENMLVEEVIQNLQILVLITEIV